MTIRTFVIGSLITALLGGGSWFLVVTKLDPQQAGSAGFILFFLSLFIATASITSLLGYGMRRIIMRRQFPAYTVRTSLRQGILIALFTTTILFLQLMRIYEWWIAIVMIAALASFELVFLGYDRTVRRKTAATGE